MKKTLDATTITNELKGGSLFFSKQTDNDKATDNAVDDAVAEARTAERTNARTNVRTNERPNERTPERANARTDERTNAPKPEAKPKQRDVMRYSFQFYRDQITAIKRLRMEKELAGENCQLSDLVREAIDDYLERANG